jgi:hypothetical protein
MKKIFATGEIYKGKLTINERKKFADAVAVMPDCEVTIFIEKIYNKRSNSQNSYYWGVLIKCFTDGYYEMTGENITQAEAHEFLKQRFNSFEVVNEKTGQVEKFPKSTTALTTIEYMQYIEHCIKFCAEFLGVVVPLPNE